MTTQGNDKNGETALIVGGGPGISASCARLFTGEGMRVAIAARNPDKPVLVDLAARFGVKNYACDASDPGAVTRLFESVTAELGNPTLVVHNIDGRMAGIFGKGITEADPDLVRDTVMNSAYSAFLVAQQAARQMLDGPPDA
ncbi:MAG: SDR family oxidoreductase, partial [Pseudomonadales bacterium]|nr:SDR family oxidoreductase [Pseudomonadales bacterium]